MRLTNQAMKELVAFKNGLLRLNRQYAMKAQ
jgi:hypothetical protein